MIFFMFLDLILTNYKQNLTFIRVFLLTLHIVQI